MPAAGRAPGLLSCLVKPAIQAETAQRHRRAIRPRACPAPWSLALKGGSRQTSWEILLDYIAAVSTMDNASGQPQARLDAAGFWQIWQCFDREGESL